MMPLTKKQKETLEKMEHHKIYTAYELGVSLATLDSIERKGYLDKNISPDYIFCPRTFIEYVRVK